jgi:hypothetical protein
MEIIGREFTAIDHGMELIECEFRIIDWIKERIECEFALHVVAEFGSGISLSWPNSLKKNATEQKSLFFFDLLIFFVDSKSRQSQQGSCFFARFVKSDHAHEISGERPFSAIGQLLPSMSQ